MWRLVGRPVALMILLVAVAYQGAVLNHYSSGFVPSLNFGLDLNNHHVPHNPAPVHHKSSYGNGNDCAVILDGAGRSSLFDYTHSVLFGGG